MQIEDRLENAVARYDATVRATTILAAEIAALPVKAQQAVAAKLATLKRDVYDKLREEILNEP